MDEFNLGLMTVAGCVLGLGLFSKKLKWIGLPDPVVLTLVGVGLGPAGVGALNPESWGDPMLLLEQASRLALAIGLMGVALRLPRDYFLRHWQPLAWILGLGMPFMWLSSSVLAAILLGLTVSTALLIGAIITPTDPVVSSAMVTGPVAEKYLPEPLRQIISAEAGTNDGLAYLFVMIAVFLATSTSGEPFGLHILGVITADILTALFMGLVMGYLAGRALRWAEKKDLIEQPSILVFATPWRWRLWL